MTTKLRQFFQRHPGAQFVIPTALLTLGLGFLCEDSYKRNFSKEAREKYAQDRVIEKETSCLVSNCLARAAGADNVMDSQDQIALARGLGYSGLIYGGEDVRLNLIYDAVGYARMSIGKEGERITINVLNETMKKYLQDAK